MGAINTIYPALDYNATGDCLNFAFTSDRFAGQAKSAILIIEEATIALLGVDSSICLNGVTFTFSTTPNASENVIEFNASPAVLMQNIMSAIQSNGSLYHFLESVQIKPDGLNIEANDCKSDLEFSLKNLPNNVSDITISESPENFDIATGAGIVPENYGVVLHLRCDGEAIKPIKEFGVFIPAITQVDCKECEIESYRIEKDLREILCGCVYTPYPSFNSSNLIRYLPERTALIDWDFHEVIGSSRNHLSLMQGQDFKIINYAVQDDKRDEFLKVLNPSPHPDGTLLMTSYESGDNVCVGQHNWVHFMASALGNSTSAITMVVAFDTANGTTIGGTIFFTVNFKIGQILEIQTGLQNLKEYAASAGVDICDVKKYTVYFSEITGPTSVANYEITFNVPSCCNCISEFIFLSSQGVYETIALNCPSQVVIEAVRDFCATCQACNVNIQTPKQKIIGMDCSEVFSVNFKKRSHYNEKIIKEFLCSTDVYFCQDGDFYAIEPITASAIDYLKKGNELNQYQFRINKANVLFN